MRCQATSPAPVSNADVTWSGPVGVLARTTRLSASVGVAVLLAIGASQANQAVSQPSIQADTDIVAVIGNDMEAATLMSATLKELRPSDGRVFVLSRQIPPDWLPRVEGVEFVRLSEPEAVARSAACGHYWIFSVANSPRPGNLRITTGQRCNAGTSGKEFARRDGEWRDTGISGVGSGWVGPPPECLACLPQR